MRRERDAFTLVELLVVLALIALLGALLAFVLPGFREKSRAAKGGQALQGWLNYARQRALYEQAPRGIRFKITPNNFTTSKYGVVECQYIEKPDDWVGGPLVPDPANANNPKFVKVQGGVNFAGTDLIKNDPSKGAISTDDIVEAGDQLEILGSGQVHWIVDIHQSNAGGPYDKLELYAAGLSQPITEEIKNYRIMRRARVSGEEPMKVPDGVVIDYFLHYSYYNPGGAALNAYFPSITSSAGEPQYFDLLFAPSGQVFDAWGAMNILWVRSEEGQTTTPEFEGNPTLVVTYANSGAVAAYDPVPAVAGTGNPYQKVK